MDQERIPSLIGAATQAIVENANRLGLTWTLRLATIVSSTNGSSTMATYDGDTVAIAVTNMTGGPLPAGQRVYVIIVPPSGNFVVGLAGQAQLGASCNNIESATAGSTTSAVYVDQPGSPSVVLTKKYADTSLKFTWAQTYFTSAPVNALFAAITAAGNQVFLGKHFIANTATSSHTPIGGVAAATGVPAGTMTWIGAWATAGGGVGALSVDTDDFWSLCIEEYWPTD